MYASKHKERQGAETGWNGIIKTSSTVNIDVCHKKTETTSGRYAQNKEDRRCNDRLYGRGHTSETTSQGKCICRYKLAVMDRNSTENETSGAGVERKGM